MLPIVGYVLMMYLLALFVLGPLTSRFTGMEQAHFSKYLLATHEGGNVALPLYLAIVGASSNTVGTHRHRQRRDGRDAQALWLHLRGQAR